MSTEQAQTNGQAQNVNGQAQGGVPKSKAIVSGPQARLNTVKSLLEKSKGSIAAVLPKHLTPERLIKIATSAASRTPELLECSPESVLLALVQAGTIGLEPNTSLHHCALVPFANRKTGKKEATLVIEYRGLLQLVYNSGQVEVMYAHDICEHDEYEYELGTNKRLFHKPVLTERGEVIAFYAIVKFKHGGNDFTIMSKAEVDKIRAGSPGKDSDAWVNHYVEQGKKTAIRRLSKTMPMALERSEAFGKALDIENRNERNIASGAGPDFSDVIEVLGEEMDPDTGEMLPVGQAKSRTDAMADRLDAKAKA